MDDGGSEPNVCLARCSVECQTGYAHPLAKACRFNQFWFFDYTGKDNSPSRSRKFALGTHTCHRQIVYLCNTAARFARMVVALLSALPPRGAPPTSNANSVCGE